MSRHVGSRIEAGRPQHRAWVALSSTKGILAAPEWGQVAVVHPEREETLPTGEGQERGENYLGV